MAEKNPDVRQIVPLKPGKCRFGEQGWDYIRSPGKLLRIVITLENRVTSISVQNSEE